MRRFLTVAGLGWVIVAGPYAAHAQSVKTDDDSVSPSVAQLLIGVPRDLVRFASIDTAKVLGVGGAASLVLHTWDEEVAEDNAPTATGSDAYTPGDWYGAFLTQTALGFSAYAIGRATKHPHLANVGARVVRAQFVSQPWVVLLKYSTQRERPDGSDSHSFPSSHVAAAFATASVLQDGYGWRAGVLSYALAGYVATARVVHSKHFLSDVAFGAAIGIAGGRTIVRTRKNRTVTAWVAPVPRGVGVSVWIRAAGGLEGPAWR